MNARYLIPVALLAALLCPGGVHGETAEKRRNVFSLSLFDSMNENGGVYLCEVVRREPSVGPSDGVIEKGKVTLSVSRTLAGPERKELTLPYAFPKEFRKNNWEYRWPRLDQIEGKRLVCVVNSNATDPVVPSIAGIDDAAYEVLVIDKNDDPKLEEMRAICDLFRAVKTAQAVSALKSALKDEREVVRSFAIQAAVGSYGKEKPDGAIEMLKAEVPQWKGSRASEGSAFLFYIGNHIPGGPPTEQARNLMIRCLAVLASSPFEETRRNTIGYLDFVIGSYSPTNEFRLKDILTASEMAALRDAWKKEAAALPSRKYLPGMLGFSQGSD